MPEEDLELDEQGTEGEEAADAKPAGKPGKLARWKKAILIGVAVVVVLAANAFFLVSFLAPETEEVAGEEVPEEADETEEVVEISSSDLLETGSVLRFEPLLANLADKEARRLVRARIELVFATAEEMERVNRSEFAMAKIQDVALSLLATKRSSELEQLEGRALFREELIVELEEILGGVKIADILLTDFIIQY